MIRYATNRLARNKNFMAIITGMTGSGKTYFGMSYALEIAKRTGIPFTIDHIAFDLEEWIDVVQKAKKGSVILFDEPQISISSKEAMTRANKIFNYIASTFRVKNLIIIFCTPYEDFIDKSARKLIHSKISMIGIDYRSKTATAKPVLTQYNPFFQQIREQFLRTYHMYPENVGSPIKKYVEWELPKPPEELCLQYEEKKQIFLNNLLESAKKEIKRLKSKKREGG